MNVKGIVKMNVKGIVDETTENINTLIELNFEYIPRDKKAMFIKAVRTISNNTGLLAGMVHGLKVRVKSLESDLRD